MNKKQLKILENNFNIYKYNDTWDLEQWTDGGVDMIININTNKNIIKELELYLDNFDIDEEIELYRQDKSYKEAFTITESVKDFENWIKYIKEIIEKLYEVQNENN